VDGAGDLGGQFFQGGEEFGADPEVTGPDVGIVFDDKALDAGFGRQLGGVEVNFLRDMAAGVGPGLEVENGFADFDIEVEAGIDFVEDAESMILV
jgi:hypothetical protein